MRWATTLLAHTDILQDYEEGFQEQEQEEPPPTHTEKQTPTPHELPKTKTENQTTNKGKDKIPPMERQLLDPLKQMRQKQAADAKLLATQYK